MQGHHNVRQPVNLGASIKSTKAQTGEFLQEAVELLKLSEIPTRVYGQWTLMGKPLWDVSEDMERDVFMSSTEAQVEKELGCKL